MYPKSSKGVSRKFQYLDIFKTQSDLGIQTIFSIPHINVTNLQIISSGSMSQIIPRCSKNRRR